MTLNKKNSTTYTIGPKTWIPRGTNQMISGLGVAVIIPIVLGIGLFLYSLFTKYEWGLVKVLGMPYNLVIDILASLLLVASPFIFGFYDPSMWNVWVLHVVVGAAVILVVIFSQTQPARDDLKY